MPRSFSEDLIDGIIWSYFIQKRIIKKISREFCVSTKTERYIYELNMTGDTSSKSQRHGPSPQMTSLKNSLF